MMNFEKGKNERKKDVRKEDREKIYQNDQNNLLTD